MISQITAGKILFTAGITNIIFILLVFSSCRCLSGSKISNWLFKYSWYKRFYAKHCYLWWAFFISVLFHTFFAFYLFGFNF